MENSRLCFLGLGYTYFPYLHLFLEGDYVILNVIVGNEATTRETLHTTRFVQEVEEVGVTSKGQGGTSSTISSENENIDLTRTLTVQQLKSRWKIWIGKFIDYKAIVPDKVKNTFYVEEGSLVVISSNDFIVKMILCKIGNSEDKTFLNGFIYGV